MTPDRDLMTSMGGLVERARKTWSRLTTSAAAWRARSEGGREDVSITDLQAAEPVRRWRAAAALKRNPLASPEAVASLVVALGDAEEFVRWHAAEALAAQEPGRVFAVLESALQDPHPVRRAGAAEALGKLGGEAATLALKRGIADGEPAVRQAIAAALGQIADPANAETLLPLIGDPEPQVVRAAARPWGRSAIRLRPARWRRRWFDPARTSWCAVRWLRPWRTYRIPTRRGRCSRPWAMRIRRCAPMPPRPWATSATRKCTARCDTWWPTRAA